MIFIANLFIKLVQVVLNGVAFHAIYFVGTQYIIALQIVILICQYMVIDSFYPPIMLH